MEQQTDIQAMITTAKAAEVSSLTQHQVAALARSGEISSLKLGNTLLIDSISLRRYDRDNCGKGRPLTQATALGALWLLSGLDATWLTYHQCRRMKLMLASIDARTFLWRVRNRSQVIRYRVSDSFREELARSLKATGLSSPLSQSLGLLNSGNILEGYCTTEDVAQLEQSCFLRRSPQGNVLVHVCAFLPDGDEMPLAVVAADLTASADSRAHECGLNAIEELLYDYQNA